jgi:hypothetical protein
LILELSCTCPHHSTACAAHGKSPTGVPMYPAAACRPSLPLMQGRDRSSMTSALQLLCSYKSICCNRAGRITLSSSRKWHKQSFTSDISHTRGPSRHHIETVLLWSHCPIMSTPGPSLHFAASILLLTIMAVCPRPDLMRCSVRLSVMPHSATSSARGEEISTTLSWNSGVNSSQF